MTYPVLGYPLFVDGAFYTAEQWREFDGGVAVQDAGTASAVSPAGGVYGNPATSMLVTAAAGMAVTVNAGYCSVPNSGGTGAYRFGLMQQAGLTVPANTTGLTRLDYVIAGVSDVGAGSSSFVEYLTGTTSVPSLPSNSIVLAEVSVPNGASGISSGNITDQRTFVAPPGCIVPVTSAAAAPVGPSGQLYYDTATSQLLYSPVTVVNEELTGTGNWTSPITGTIAARAIGGGGGGTGLNSGSPGSQTFYFTQEFAPEQGVTAVTVQLWGDGGGGGWHNGHLGGGGGGGGYILATGIPVSYPNTYTVNIGGGGPGGTSSSGSGSGQGTSFAGDGGVSLTASGGSNGTGTSAGSGASATSSGTSGTTVTYTGGDGGYNGSTVGGGGGGAGSAGDGGSGGEGGGFGGSPDGGYGGGDYSSGQQPGGGGGGAASRAGESNAGNGGSGMAIISWSPDSQGGGGGGGGEMAYEPELEVVQGTAYPYSVGTGGGDSVSGTNTTLQGQSVTLLAGGGQATSATATGGAGGNLSNNFLHYPGGQGGTGAASGGEFGFGGGGGASGSSTGAGQAGGAATTTSAGSGGMAGPYGGAGGAGGNQAPGGAGAVPGGGGGGSPGEGLGFAAGSGGDGTLTLNYTIAPGGIPFQLANPQTWYAYEPSGSLSSVSLSMTADGTSDYEIAVFASNTGPESGGTTHGSLEILANGRVLDSVAAQSSTGVSSAGHWNAGWSYYTSGAQGTTLAANDYTIEFASSFGTLTAPAWIRVTQVLR